MKPHYFSQQKFIAQTFSIALMLLLAAFVAFGQTKMPELSFAQTVERELSGGQTHEYQVTLKAGEFMQVRVEQKGIDVVLSVYSADGAKLAEMDSPNGTEDFETVSVIAEKAGNFTIKVIRLEEEGNTEFGRYNITLNAKRNSTVLDGKRIGAEKFFVSLNPLLEQNTKEGRIEAIKQYKTALEVWQELKDEYLIELTRYLIRSKEQELAVAGSEARREVSEAKRRKKLDENADYPQLIIAAGHSGSISTAAFSPDGHLLASGSNDNTIILWDTVSRREVRKIEPRSSRINSVVFSPDGKLLASADIGSKTVKLWDVRTGKLIKTLKGHNEAVNAVAFSSDGKMLVSGSGDWTVKLWNVVSGEEIKTFQGHSNSVRSVAFSPNGAVLASGSFDKTVKLWSLQTGEELLAIPVNVQNPSVGFSSDGKTLVCNVEDKIKFWDINSGRQSITLIGDNGEIKFAAYSPNGEILASVSDKNITLWNIASGKRIKDVPLSCPAVAFSKDGEIMVTGDRSELKLWNVFSGREINTFGGLYSSITNVDLSPNGRVLAAGDFNSTISLWNLAAQEELKTLSGHSDSINSIAFSPDGKTLASGSYKEIKLWNAAAGQEIRTLAGHAGVVWFLMFSPDGRTLSSQAYSPSGDYLNEYNLWEVKTGKLLSVLNTPPDWAAIFSKDVFVINGKKIRPERDGKAVRLVDDETEEDLATLIALNNNDWAVVDADGRWDASDGAQKLMYYTIAAPEGYEIINFSQLKERYYEPNLLQKILGYNKESLRDVGQFKDVLPPPVVEPVAPQNAAATVRQIKIKNRRGGIGRVQVFVNGREFIEDARDAKLKANPNLPEYVLSFDLKDAAVIAGQKPDVRVVAWNYDAKAKEKYKGYISSRGTEIIYFGNDAENAEPPTLYAVIGGTSDYKGSALDLRFAAKDAEDIYRAIQVGGKNLFGVERLKLKLLSTSANKDAVAPTKENFRRAFEEFAREAEPNDILFVYLAGHGITLNFGSDTYYYLTQDAATSDREILSRDGSLLAGSTINSEELTQWHKNVKAQKQVLILDTCAAGALGNEFKIIEPRELSSDAKRAIAKMRDRVSFHVLMGSAANAASYEASQYGQGLLTYSLLQGIKGAALQSDGQVDVSRLFNYAADTVPNLAKNIGGIQRPEIRIPVGGTSFALGLIQNDDDKKQIPLAVVKPVILRPNFQNQDLIQDNLKLGNLLRNRLREIESVIISSNVNAGLVYVDTDEMPDAIIPAGRYSVEGESIKIVIRLTKNDETIEIINLEGDKNDLPKIVERIIEEILSRLKKAKTNQKMIAA